MHHKIFLILFAICILSFFLLTQANPDKLISRCRSALNTDIKEKQARKEMSNLIQEIKNRETLYLKSSLYPDIRKNYEKLNVKLGDYYYKKDDFNRALECYNEADKYSDYGYRKKIDACRQHLGWGDVKIEPQLPPVSPSNTNLYYNKIAKLWQDVNVINDEKKAVSLVLSNVPLLTDKNKAYLKLTAIREQWNHFFQPDLSASTDLMLSDLYARTDNPDWQLKMLGNIMHYFKNHHTNYVLHPHKGRVNEDWILNTMKNVKHFLSLRDSYINPKATKTSKINRLVKTINYNYLTPAQQIKSHYMLGILLKQGNIFITACYHLYKAIQLMNQYGLDKVSIVWEKHSASKEPTVQLLGETVMLLKKNPGFERQFIKVYGENCFAEIQQIAAKFIKPKYKDSQNTIRWIVIIVIGLIIGIAIIKKIADR